MPTGYHFSSLLLLIALLSALPGCAALPSTTSRAEMSYVSPTLVDLQRLPAPAGKVFVAVYGFRDQTGQFKPNPAGTSFSTSVTQGAASILVQTLRRSKWFVPVEREGLNNILTERKIVRAAVQKPANGAPAPEPRPLIPAAIVIDGGIIAYDTNILTGGMGAKYFGAGGSAEFRSDRVTVFLRAVNVETGEVINSVSASKTILSQQVDFSLFRFVSLQRLLEAEIGFGANEPPQQCVQEAIEKAVLALVVDGIAAGHWNLKSKADLNNPVIHAYMKEATQSYSTEVGTSQPSRPEAGSLL